jgi:hypothetical protein
MKRRRTDKEKMMLRKLSQIRSRAKREDLDFDLDIEYLMNISRDTCKYSGRKLNYIDGKKFNRETEDQATLCRKDYFRGFIRGNVEWIGSYVHYYDRKMTESRIPTPRSRNRF